MANFSLKEEVTKEIKKHSIDKKDALYLMYGDNIAYKPSLIRYTKSKGAGLYVDFCKSSFNNSLKDAIIEIIKSMDIMLLSDHEDTIYKEYFEKFSRDDALMIYHTPKSINLKTKCWELDYDNTYFQEGIKNSVGAGDIFGVFICEYFNRCNKNEWKEKGESFAKKACVETSRYLKLINR